MNNLNTKKIKNGYGTINNLDMSSYLNNYEGLKKLIGKNIDDNLLPFIDHSSLWLDKATGEPKTFIIQIYEQQLDKYVIDYVMFARKYGLVVTFNAHESWWNPGRCVAIEFRKK